MERWLDGILNLKASCKYTVQTLAHSYYDCVMARYMHTVMYTYTVVYKLSACHY